MDNSNFIIPPHLNAEIYRSDTTNNISPYLDFIRIHPGALKNLREPKCIVPPRCHAVPVSKPTNLYFRDVHVQNGNVLVGCSELTGRHWDGSVSVFKSISEAKELHKEAKKSIELSTGTPDGYFVQNYNKVLLCEDSGAISIWSVSEDAWKVWSQDHCVTEHDDAALTVDCLVPGSDYVTVGADGNAKVWDINEMICLRHYARAHNRAIYGVATRPGSYTSFATASLDRYISLWGELVTKPVLDLVKNDHGVRCLQWLDENRLVFGDEGGALRLVDIRNADSVTKLATFPAAVHRLAVHPHQSKLAVCCDNKTVSVCDMSVNGFAQTVYQDRLKHSHYVRGLAWDARETNTLHSVAWDGEIRTHDVTVTLGDNL